MKKRIISLLLTVAMFISAIPVIANADAVVNEPSFKSVSLTLDGILSLNVKVNPGSVSDMSGYKVKFTVGEDTPWECTEPVYNESTNLYVYTAKIPAHKLQKSVKVELLDADNAILDEGSWTLDAYLASIVEWDGGLNGLADALELYATNAAAYATGSDSIAPSTTVEQADLLDYKCEIETEGDVIPSAVLLLNDACTLRVQVSADKWVDGYSLKMGGEAKDLEYNETKGIYYYDIKDIRAQEWGTKYVVEIVDSSDATLYKVNYAVMSYVYTVLGKPDDYAKELDLLKSMYLYFQGADNYKNAERFDYSLTYNANYEGSDETKVESATNITATSKDYTVGDNPFQRPGYKFVGWNTKADGTGTSYNVGDTLALKAVDTLMDEDFSAISDTWKPYENGTEATTNYWSVADGVLKHNNANKTTTDISVLMLDTAVTADNYEITANLVMPKSNFSIGLVFADNQFFRIWNNGSGTFKWYAGSDVNNANSNYSGLGGVSISLNSGDKVTVKVKVEGNQFSIFANDTLLTETPVTANKDQLTGKIGLYVRSPGNDDFAAFNDIKVSAAKTTETLYAQWEEDVLFSENLGELTELPSTWTHLNYGTAQGDASAWSASDGVMKYTGTSDKNQALLFDTINADNYEITANVVMQSSGSVGLIFANTHYFRILYNGSAFYLYVGYTAENFKSLRTPYGSSQQLGSSYGLAVGEVATLKVVVEGTTFTVWVNGKEAKTADASTITDATWVRSDLYGKFGLLQMNATGDAFGFKDIKVAETVVNAG